MPELIFEYETRVVGANGATYSVRCLGEPGSADTWIGWLEFRPLDNGPVLRTDRETTQPDLDALRYWASGVEPIFLEGALTRAR